MNVFDPELARAVEEALMSHETTTQNALAAIEHQWNQHLVAGATPAEAASQLLADHAVAIGVPDPTDATDAADLVESLLAEAFSDPASHSMLETVAWLWQAGATSGRPDDAPAVYITLALLLAADRRGADVQDLLERVGRQLADDHLAEA